MAKRSIITYHQRLAVLAKHLKKKSTLSEVILWNHIKSRKMLGIKFQRQKVIGRYIVDFYSKELKLAIEIDGNSHDKRLEADQNREEELNRMGMKVYRILDIDVKKTSMVFLRG
ncbi:MAG: endonuclease domain-containing protein [Thermotogota bacterium]|nr:endonuclease domain-containing protein [Thermotogota bacterium]